ncbi:MAG: hypothetical protein ACI8TL_000965 [Natronomonas sp.]|jgi:hypothetical protein
MSRYVCINPPVIAAGPAALSAFPLVVYGVMRFASRCKETGRPEPPETNGSR